MRPFLARPRGLSLASFPFWNKQCNQVLKIIAPFLPICTSLAPPSCAGQRSALVDRGRRSEGEPGSGGWCWPMSSPGGEQGSWAYFGCGGNGEAARGSGSVLVCLSIYRHPQAATQQRASGAMRRRGQLASGRLQNRRWGDRRDRWCQAARSQEGFWYHVVIARFCLQPAKNKSARPGSPACPSGGPRSSRKGVLRDATAAPPLPIQGISTLRRRMSRI